VYPVRSLGGELCHITGVTFASLAIVLLSEFDADLFG
jgi:hypothetical protein